MRILTSVGLTAILLAASACTIETSSPSTTANNLLTALSGTWRSTTAATAGACSSTSYTITPTGTNSANITYAANCAGITVSGSGTGTLNGTTLNWTSTGNAGVCPFSLDGTATPTGTTSDLNLTYSGTVCGAPLSGAEILHR